MKGIGCPALDQPEPVDVGDVVATHRLPWEAGDMGYFLARLADEWEGHSLHVRQGANGIEVFVESIEDA